MLQRRPRRVSAGRAKAWQAALAFGWQCRRTLGMFLAVLVAVVVFVNLPWWPTYERGLLTGALLVFAAWLVSWVLWVSSGLSFRLNGVWAEEGTLESLRKSRHVHEVIPSFKFDGYDIDAVAVCPAGVVAIETKWRYADTPRDYLQAVANQAASGSRSLRHQISTDGLAIDLVTAAAVLWGPGGRTLPPTRIPTTAGSVREATVLGADHLDGWLEGLGRGPLGPDYARRVFHDLQPLAVTRDRTSIQGGPILRWLAKVR